MLGLRTNLSRRGFFRLGFAGSLASILPRRLFGRRRSGLTNEDRTRLRDLGIVIGRLPTGPHNNITDVNGVLVGHTTKISGSGKLEVGVGPVRTGVTTILPRSGNEYSEALNAGLFILNGNGELTGFSRTRNSGVLETPIFLTGTANVGIVYDAALTYLLNKHPEIGKTS
ncbi:MAG: D-aminopeptidase, partial [Planctomycetota bacterium]